MQTYPSFEFVKQAGPFPAVPLKVLYHTQEKSVESSRHVQERCDLSVWRERLPPGRKVRTGLLAWGKERAKNDADRKMASWLVPGAGIGLKCASRCVSRSRCSFRAFAYFRPIAHAVVGRIRTQDPEEVSQLDSRSPMKFVTGIERRWYHMWCVVKR